MGHFDWYFRLVDLPLTVVPILVAEKRRCKNMPLIYFLSFFLGWTIVGGIAALIVALAGETRPEQKPEKETEV